MALSITVSSPSNNATGVYKNALIYVTFNEALDVTSVTPGSIILRNLLTKEQVELDFTFSADNKTVYIKPLRFLAPNTTYKLTIVGTNTKIYQALENYSNVELTTTQYISFSTNDSIENEAPSKTAAELADEGEISLPSNLQVVGETSEMSILETYPQNRDFYLDCDLDEISIVFDQTLATSTIDADSVEVTISAYYDEDEEFLAYPLTSEATPNWKFQDPHHEDGQPIDFRDIEGELSVDGDTVTWTRTDAREFPKNSKVTVTISTDVTSVDGLTLPNDKRFVFYMEPYPNEVSIDRIKDEMSPYSIAAITDDIIGKTIYKNSMNAMDLVRYGYNHLVPNRTLARYIVASTCLDILEALKMEADMKGGQFKKLGDLVVRYDADIGKAYPAKFLKMAKEKEELERTLIGVWTQAVKTVTKGMYSPYQRINLRTRLWKQDLLNALEGHIIGVHTAGNTTEERATKVPGRADNW